MSDQSWIVKDYAALVRVFKILRRQLEGPKPKPLLVSSEPWHRQRSEAQNRLYWWWLGIIAEHWNAAKGEHTVDDDWHEWFRKRFIRRRVRKMGRRKVEARKSTTELNVVQFSGYLTKIEQYCDDRLDLVLPRPEELYEAAVRGPKEKGPDEPAPVEQHFNNAKATASWLAGDSAEPARTPAPSVPP